MSCLVGATVQKAATFSLRWYKTEKQHIGEAVSRECTTCFARNKWFDKKVAY